MLYEEKCEMCLDLEAENRGHEGCWIHRANPGPWRIGNPKMSEILENAQAYSARLGSDYIAIGDAPLTPDDVLSI
jgi:hypothetical protein